MGKIYKRENWVPYELKLRNAEQRFFACEQLLQGQNWNGFVNRIVTCDKKLVHYDNPKRKIVIDDTSQSIDTLYRYVSVVFVSIRRKNRIKVSI